MILNRSFSGARINAGFSYVAPTADTTPDAIPGQTISNAPLSQVVTFDPVQITGIDAEVTASISGGEMAVSIDGITYGAFSSSSQPVQNDYWVQVRAPSSGTNNGQVVATLSVDTVNAAFTSNTVAASVGYGLRDLIYIRSTVTQEAPQLSKNATGLYVNVIDKGIEVTDATTDENGYLVLSDAIFATLGEEVRVYIETSDGALTAAGTLLVEDVNEYL
jgi:hypothetical protein